LFGNLVISSQTSGTTGGVGLYQTSSIQPSVTSPFVIQGVTIQGIGSQQIQNNLNNENLIMMNTTNSTIFETSGFDISNLQRSMRISPWSVLVRNTKAPNTYFVTPSFGSNINQVKPEAFRFGLMKQELSNNPSMFNGSVRLFWDAPQFGWFDNSRVVKNDPETYMKKILFNEANQQNFSINGNTSEYSNFEELFTTFDTSVLDYLESEFLNFSRSIYDFEDTLPNPLIEQELVPGSQRRVNEITDAERSYKNFQALMRELMVINKPTGDSPEVKLENVITEQNQKFQSVLSEFINYDVAFKYGNPSNFDKRLFYTFSSKFIEEPIIYGPYEQGNLPPQVTLSQSKKQNPYMKTFSKTLKLETKKQFELADITSGVSIAVLESGINDGLVTVFAPHTTAAIKINHNEPLLVQDFMKALYRLVPLDMSYSHDLFEVRQNLTPNERSNGHAHVKSFLLGASETLIIEKGVLVLGQRQSIFFVETDGGRNREVKIKIIGE
jgi:secondary thiamine-phosphate synthase enzyme